MKIKKYILLLSISIFLTSCTGVKNNTIASSCLQEKEIGLCKALIPKYYFDKNTNSCKVFYWGGCGGSVPFNSINECQQTCE